MEFYNEKLKKLRKQSAISVKYITKILGVGRSTYWNWENKIRIPSEQHVRELAQLFNISVSSISNLKETEVKDIYNSAEIKNWENLTYNQGHELVQAQKQALQKLQTTTEELSKVWSVVYGMMKSLKSIIYIKGENSKFILANDAFKNNLGLNLTYKVSNKNDSDFFTIKEARKNYAEDYEVLTTGKDISGKIDFIPGTRKKRIGLIFKHPIYNHKGEISGIICSYDDITEIKTLQKDKSLLVKAYKSISDIVSITEAETGKLMFVSDSAEKHTGHSHKVYSNSISILNIMHPEDRAKELEYRKKGITPESRQFRIIHKNGSIVWFETKHYDIIHDNKKYICNIARNITEKKTAETKLSEYKELIAEKLKAKGLSLEEINEIIY